VHFGVVVQVIIQERAAPNEIKRPWNLSACHCHVVANIDGKSPSRNYISHAVVTVRLHLGFRGSISEPPKLRTSCLHARQSFFS
jgi:hypothetical protein